MDKGKNYLTIILSKTGAQKKTRTSTPLTGLAPETSASTNFAIWATELI